MNDVYAACWDILVQHAGADVEPRAKEDFLRYIRSNPEDIEYRFCGVLGFGGKFRYYQKQLYVTCYIEDETPERLEVMKKVNVLLADVRV